MRSLIMLSFVAALAKAGVSQTLALKPPTPQFVTVAAGTSAPEVAPGGTVTLWADITPKPNIHVYAAGAKDFMAVEVVMTPRAGIVAAKPSYPPSERLLVTGATAPVPVYRTMFRIAQPVTLSKSARVGETMTLSGAVNYQACDDKVCYPPASITALWNITVK